MEFALDRTVASNALGHIVRVVPSQAVRPALTGVLLTAREGWLTIAATDTQQTLVTTVPADVAVPGAAVVPGRYLHELFRRIPQGTVQCKMADDGLELEVRWERSAFTIPGFPPDQYPSVPGFPGSPVATIASNTLQDAIGATMYASAIGDTARPLLTGVKLQMGAYELQALATNGFQVAWYHGPLESGTPQTISFVVPSTALGHLLRVLEEGVRCEIATRGSEILFRVGSTHLATRVLEGEYPRVLELIPQEFPITARVAADDFVAAFERVALATEDYSPFAVSLTLGEGEIAFTSEGPSRGKAAESVPGQCTAGGFHASFNSRQLLDGIRHLGDGEILAEFSGEGSIARFRSNPGGCLDYMQMPLDE